MSETFPILSSPISSDMTNDTYNFFVNDNGQLKQVDKDIVKNYLGTITWDNVLDKPFISLDEDMFTIENSKLSITHDHTHDNKVDVLDNLSVNDEGTLLFNGKEISSGGGDGTTIADWTTNTDYSIDDLVIYENILYQCAREHTSGSLFDESSWQLIGDKNTIPEWQSGVEYNINDMVKFNYFILYCTTAHTSYGVAPANEWRVVNGYTLPQATSTTLGGVKVDGDTIIINSDGVINVNGKLITVYANNVEYAAEDIVIYENSLYTRIADGTDTAWNSDNWTKISGSGGGKDGTNAYVHIKYSAIEPTSDSDMSDIPNDYMGIYSGILSTSPTTYSSYTWFKIKGEDGIDGATGEKGADGTDGASAYEVAVKNGYTGTETQWLASLKGADGKDGVDGTDGVTTVTTSKVDMTCTFTASGWSSTIPYTQTVSVEGITEELNPRIDVIISDNLATGKSEEVAFACFTKAITGNGTITAYCYENKPEVDLNIMIEVV